MNNKILLGAALLSAGALAWAAKDPVVMTVAGVDVPKSEFEYLYHKNSQQQLEAQPLEEYVEMFKKYKLKVADAKAMGIDTTAAFRKEMQQFRSELAAPYLADSAFIYSLVDETYKRLQTEVPTSHIMYFKTGGANADSASRHTLDSLRNVILAGGNFEELANKYSQDRGSNTKGGSLGYITANRFPYSFETAAYSLKPGEISKIVESPVGFHLIKVGESRPASGEVLVGHILILSKDSDPEDVRMKAEAKADSIYNEIMKDPAAFEYYAREFSQDPGSAKNGGMLPWFGTGRMVPEFEQASFALSDGQISKPVKSQFGWHIIRKVGSRGIPSLGEMRPNLVRRVLHPQDERSAMVRDHQTAVLSKKLKGHYTKDLQKIRQEIRANGLDSAFYAKYEGTAAGNIPIIAIGKKTHTLSEFLPRMRHLTQNKGELADKYFGEALNAFFNACLVDAETDELEKNVADYRNLLHEYRDGSLLYEASVRKVWDRASKDREGLEKFFEANRADYTWTEPRAKGILVQAKNDSVAKAVQIRYMQLGKDSALNVLRNEFKGNVKFDNVLAPKGTNAMVDNLLFGGVEVQPSVAGFESYFMLEPRVIPAPEEMNDVRAQVVSDYQNELERQWVEELRAKYPVVVREKELKKIRPVADHK